MTAEQAKDYGITDEMIRKRRWGASGTSGH